VRGSSAQQRILDGMADGLRRTEPRLAAMYAMFTRLCRSDGPPSLEQLRSGRDRYVLAAIGALVARLPRGLRMHGRRARWAALITCQLAIVIVLFTLAGLSWRSPAACVQSGRQPSVMHTRLWCPAPAAANGLMGK